MMFFVQINFILIVIQVSAFIFQIRSDDQHNWIDNKKTQVYGKKLDEQDKAAKLAQVSLQKQLIQLLIYNSQEKTLINLRMYNDSIAYSSRSTISSPIMAKRSPPKFASTDYKYYESPNVNKSVGYSNFEDWSNSDYPNLRKVSDDISNLRQTFDVRAHSNYQNIFNKYSQDNEETIRSPQKTELNLRQTFSTKPRFLDNNYLSSSTSIPDGKYQFSSAQNQKEFKMLKSPSKTQKKQIQTNKYKEIDEILIKNKMDKELDKLKQDRKKRLEGSKDGSRDEAFKKKNLENIYSPKYQKKEKIEIIQFQQSKTVPVINNSLASFKTNTMIKISSPPSSTSKGIQKQEKLYKQSSSYQPNTNYQPYKLNKEKSVTDNFVHVQSPTFKAVSKISTLTAPHPAVSINDFHIVKTLGEGKFGVVQQAFHKQTGAIFAIKKVPKQRIKKFGLENQFILQLKLQTFLKHQNILKLFHFFDDETSIYLVLEYMEQGTLFYHLKKNKTLPEREVAIKMKQIASAIKYLHQNQIAHRDIKPENIVLTNNVCKLCDFGWATICKDRRTTCCGTFDYTPPEIFQGSDYDDTVDLWCLGVLTYELLVGKAPFYHSRREETKRRILNVETTAITYPEHLSKNAISFIDSLIKKDPNQRLSSQKLLSHPFLLVNEDEL